MGNCSTEAKLNAIKKSPDKKPLSHFVGNWKQVESIWNEIPAGAQKLAKHFWPGPLTLIAGTPNAIGIRMPQIEPLLALLQKTGPTLCTSANFSGTEAPKSLAEVDPNLSMRVDFIIAEPAPQSSGHASTILQFDHEKNRWTCLREGFITQTAWSEVLST